MESKSPSKGKIAIVGSGLIGRSWAMLFLGAGYNVTIYDVIGKQVTDALFDIDIRLKNLQQSGMLRGKSTAKEQSQLLTGTEDLKHCLQEAIYVQECVPESLEMKASIFKDLDSFSDVETILASSSSAIPSSAFTEFLQHRERCVIAHPVNPPYYMPLVEIVPSPWTSADVVDRTRQLMTDIGQSPVTLKKEIRGFVQPRIQYAIIMECLKLVQEDIVDIEDVDKLIKEGLGLIYAFIGPFEMIHLNNKEGISSFFGDERRETVADAEAIAPSSVDGVAAAGAAAVSMNVMSSKLVIKISDELTNLFPLGSLGQRRQWRDDRLAALAKLRNDMSKNPLLQ